jgi:hypothetical protein
MNRQTDTTAKTRFRSERFFTSQGQWFCNTREGRILGPFPNREEAQSALLDYLLELGIRPQDAWSAPGAQN